MNVWNESFISSLEGPAPNCNSCVEVQSWNWALTWQQEKTNWDGFVLAQTRRVHAIPLGCHSGLGSGAAQESFFWHLQETNTSAASALSLQELYPVWVIFKFHYSQGRRNEGDRTLSPAGRKHQGCCKEPWSLNPGVCYQGVSCG